MLDITLFFTLYLFVCVCVFRQKAIKMHVSIHNVNTLRIIVPLAAPTVYKNDTQLDQNI